MTLLTPDQLPASNAQFIAYGTPERIADPLGGDDPVTVRPQVFVRYYRGIKIKELRTPKEDTVNLVLDPESVGLQKEFGAYMNADDPLVAYLREQHEAGKPIDLGLEYVRNKKAKDSKALISPATPIHALRGANAPDGSGDNSTMMGAAGNHISSKVALVNGRRSKVIHSDPREWQVLTSNRQGDLPPEGWKALLDREDWTKVGTITPKGGVAPAAQQNGQQQSGQPQQNGTGLDPNAFAKIIRNEVRLALKDYGEYLQTQESATRGNPTSSQTNSTTEGKPWTVRVNKDHLNLGSYLVTGEGYALRWAYRYLEERGDQALTTDEEIHWAAAQELADASQRIADRVQSAAYNGEVRADRVSASFRESTAWVRFQIEQRYPFETTEDFDFDAWFDAVGRAATLGLRQSETNAGTFLAERYPQAEQKTKPAATKDERADDASDNAPVLDAFLQVLAHSWTDRDGILALAGEAKDKDLLATAVWAAPREGRFATEEFEGAREITIADLTKVQYGLLSQAAQQAPETDSVPEAAGDTESPQPEAQPEARAPEESAETPAPQAPSEKTPASGARTAQHIAADLARATAEEHIAAAFTEARDLNFLTTEITVKTGQGPFGIVPVSPSTDGAESMALGAVFDAIRTGMETNSAAPAPAVEEEEPPVAEPAPTPASAPAPAEQENAGGTSPAMDIAERALEATTAEQIEGLYAEAQAAGIENETVTVRSGSGPLAGFLKSRMKRVRSSNG